MGCVAQMPNGGAVNHPLMARAFALWRQVATALRRRRVRETVAALLATEADAILETIADFVVGA